MPIEAYADLITSKVDPNSAEKLLFPVPDYIIQTRYNFFEAKRQHLIEKLLKERDTIIETEKNPVFPDDQIRRSGRVSMTSSSSAAGFTAQGILAVTGGVSVWMVWCREPVKAVPAASRIFQVMATLWAGAKSGRCRVTVR